MKNILVLTDFSADANHAAAYAYQFAKQINAGVIFCNAVIIPAQTPQAGLVAWPMQDAELLLNDSKEELKHLQVQMQQYDGGDTGETAITLIAEAGTLTDVVDRIIGTQHVQLVVMGTHASDSLSTVVLGNHCSNMIDNELKSLLLIPPTAKFEPIKKIAFAIDLEHAEEGLQELFKLIPMAKALNAEILITNIQQDMQQPAKFDERIKQFLTEVTNKADYSNIYYRMLSGDDTEKGLVWLCEHGQIDMLAMLHRHHGFFDSLFNGSHTHRMSSRINIPLLVLSA